jgi:MEDS: MEthanogen/methylotroph, DcmR Sensory domain
MLERVLAPALDGGACPHLAVLLKTADELRPLHASFYALGAKRNGWMAHRSRAGEAEFDRERLSGAGLDVEALEHDGRLAVVEFDPDEKPDASPEPWQKALEEALGRGLSALWYSRYAVGPSEAQYKSVVAFEAAWDQAFKNKPVVTLCPYVVGDLTGSGAIERMQGVSEFHDGLLVPNRDDDYTLFETAVILSLTDRRVGWMPLPIATGPPHR